MGVSYVPLRQRSLLRGVPSQADTSAIAALIKSRMRVHTCLTLLRTRTQQRATIFRVSSGLRYGDAKNADPKQAKHVFLHSMLAPIAVDFQLFLGLLTAVQLERI